MATDIQNQRGRGATKGEAPEKPTHLRTGSGFGVFRRTIREFRADNLTDWAAALTYYGVLAIFPALIALVSILGLVGHSATQPLISNLDKLAPRVRRGRSSPARSTTSSTARAPPESCSSSASPARCGRRRGTSARS